MAGPGNSIYRKARAFAQDQRGNVTVEFALWVPVLLGILFLSADASMLFMNQSNFWNVSRDTARVVARHGMDRAAAEAYARKQASFGTHQPDVHVEIDDLAATVTVTITANTRDIAPFDVVGLALGQTIRAEVTQTLEPL